MNPAHITDVLCR